MGYTMKAGPECEFFLFHTDEDGLPTTLTHEQGGYFDVGPLDFGENARRDMVLTLEEMGFVIESSYHETAPAQHEIDFQFDEALVTADNIMTFKMAVKTIAKRHGLHATFMPKPRFGENGSGMHINMSLSREGKNILREISPIWKSWELPERRNTRSFGKPWRGLPMKEKHRCFSRTKKMF